jgi:uncharacterized protein (DUF433 family)
VKKVLAEMVIKWYERGYTVDEIAPLLPQCNRAEIELLIKQHDKGEHE